MAVEGHRIWRGSSVERAGLFACADFDGSAIFAELFWVVRELRTLVRRARGSCGRGTGGADAVAGDAQIRALERSNRRQLFNARRARA